MKNKYTYKTELILFTTIKNFKNGLQKKKKKKKKKMKCERSLQFNILYGNYLGEKQFMLFVFLKGSPMYFSSRPLILQ